MTGAGLLRRAAAGADVPVFLAQGTGAGDVETRLRASSRVALVDSPRAATVLVVAGHVPGEHDEALARVHDQMAHPRATVRWPDDDVGDDVEAAVVVAHAELCTGARASEPPILPDVDPAPWRGVGPYGHGGTGMTGGVPYGRPMAGRADDRDGLALDVVPLRVGPFFPLLPPGIVLEVTFAGDVVHDARVAVPAAPVAPPTPATIAELEMARARHHLRWLARLLHLQGLDALACRVATWALDDPDPAALDALARRLDRPWALGRTTRGVGVVTGDDAGAWGGPVARAAGVPVDARASAPSYLALGFEPVVHAAGDVRDRWRQRLAEAAQAADLAARAGAARIDPGEPIEPPVPPPPDDAPDRLAALLVGAEWGDALATVASLGPDLAAGAPTGVPA